MTIDKIYEKYYTSKGITLEEDTDVCFEIPGYFGVEDITDELINKFWEDLYEYENLREEICRLNDLSVEYSQPFIEEVMNLGLYDYFVNYDIDEYDLVEYKNCIESIFRNIGVDLVD